MIMTIRKYTILFFFLLTSFVYAGYNDLVFTPYFQYPKSGVPIVGTYNIAIGFVTENYYSDSFICPYLNFDVVDGEMICTVNQEVNITDGFATIVLDNMTNLDAFKTPRLQPKFFKEISGDYTAIQPSDNDFLFNSAAFSIMSYKSDYIVFPQAEKLAETSEFDNSFVIDAGLDLGFMRFSKTRPYWSNKSSNDNQYDVDVSVSINVDTNYFKNGIPLSQTLLWSTSSSSDGLYTLDSVHINGVVNYELGVNGTVLAHDYYWGDSSIDLLSSWVTANAGADYLYYEATTKNVGFGVSSLEERVNVAGLLLMEYGEPVTSTGSIYVKNGDFMGVVDLSDGSGGFEAVTLNALQVLGQPNQVAFFSDYRTLDSDSDLAIYSSDAAISIFDLSGGPVRIQDDFVVVSADNTILFGVNSGLGNFVITNNNDQVNFILSGGFEAEDYYLNGLPIYLQMAQGEYFYKNPILSSVDNYVVYYDRGHIVLGRSESSDSKAVLEISNPYLDPSLPVIDPAISFVREDVSDSNNNIVFSMGVSNKFNDQFVVVDGYDLNVGTPLLVVKRDYLGVGVSQPKASLSISGNTGIMIQGDLKFFDDVSRVDVISAFDEPGLKMYFNPYSAAFRVGEFFASENYYQNVGVFSAAIGVASQVSGNLSSALGGIRNDVSGIYSTAIGGFSNNISQGFSLGLGIGSQIDHDGSFVFSHGGYYAGNSYNNIDNFPEISEGDRFKTADSRQFLIGAPSPSYLGTSFGINTNNTSGILTVKAQTILPSVLEDKLSLSLSEANTLFDLLVDNDFLDSVGNLNVYDKRAFNDYYTLDDFPIIVSINSVEVFNTLVATINNHDLSGVVTSSNLKEWGVISQSHWEAYYSPNFDTGAASTFVDSAGDGLHLLFVDMTVDDTVGTILDQLVVDGVLDDQKTFYGCTFDGSQYDYNGNTYGETSTENLIIEIILNTYPSVVDGKIMTDYSANFSTSNLQELMSAVLDQDGVTCDDFDSKMIAAEDLSDKIKEVDVDTVEMPFDDIDTCGINPQAVECKYTYVAYKYYLDNTIYPDLFVKIRNDIDSNVFDLDMVSSGSYLISDFDETYSSDLAAISTTLTTTNVQAVLQELATANIITLRGTNKESRFHVQNDGMVGVGYDVVDRADLAVNGMTYISHLDVTDFVTTPALLVIDNLYDSTEDDTEQSLYPDSLVVRKDLEDYVPTPVFMINSSGIVGIGDVVSSSDKNFSLVSMGSIHAGGLTTPAGDISPEVVIVFQWDELTTPNIYFVDGFLGLGLVSPNRPQSLLHLTYYNGNSIPQPVLSFDYNDEELVKLGGMAPSSAGFRIAKAESLYTDPAFFVSSDVGAMNMPGFFSDEPGVVSGSFGVNSGVMLVNTDNQRQDVGASFVTNEFHTKSFYLKQDSGFAKVTSSGFPWNFDHDNNNIFLNDGSRIGIGTSEPQYDLDVSGNFAFISTDEILTVENRLFVDELYLTTKNYAVADDIYLKFSDPIFDNVGLLVRSQDLFLRFGSLDINQTDQLKYGSGKCGDLVLLNVMNVNEVFGSLYYDPEGTQLCGQSSNGYPSENVNFVFDFNDVTKNYWTYDDSLEVWTVVDSSDAVITDNMSQFIITGSVDIQLDNQVNGFATVNNNFVFPYSLNSNYYGVYFNSTIRYDGDFWNDSFSHSFTSLNIRIVSNNNNNVDEADYTVKGLDISIDNIDQTGHIKTLDDRAQVIGLYSDLTNVNAQESGESISGYRFPAIFFGDVLMSTSNRNADVSRDLDILINDDKMPLLSIKGTLKADALVISDALYSPTLFVNAGYQKSFNVGNNGDAVLPRPRVGINVLEPTVELDIAGNVKADTLQVGVLNSNFIDHQDNKFVVLENGFVGFGKTERFVNEQVLFYKLFDSYQTGLFDYKSYHFDIDSDPDVTTDFTGLGIEIFTSENNYVGLDVPVVVKGMDVDLTGITNMDTAVLTGVYSDVTANSHSYAAVFLSANVGIGVLEPEVALHINGDIRTNDYDGISNYLTTMDNFGVGDLVVTGSAFMNHVVANRVSVNSLILMPGIDFDFDTMVATDNQSISLNLNVNNSLSVVTLNNVTILTVQNDMIIDHLEVVSGSVSNRVRLDLEDITYDFDVDLALQSFSIDTDTLDVGSIIVANNQYYDNNYVPILRVDDGYFYVNDTVPEQYRHPVSVRVDVTTNVVDRGDGNQSSFVPNNVRSWNSMGLFSGVTDNETYVALSLYPHADHLQNWVLLSKLWKSHVNSELNLTHSELDLAFYNFENDVDKAGNFTSPNVSGAFVAPELYVSSNGQVLLFPNQLDFRDYANHTLFNVYGTARFVNSDGDYSLLPTVKMTTLNVTTINHTGLITIGKIRDNIYINNDVVVSDNVFVENGINMEYMDPYDNRINQEESIALYVVSKNNQSDIHINLNVQGKVVSTNLMDSVATRANSVLVFSDGGIVTPSSLMVTDNTEVGNAYVTFHDASTSNRVLLRSFVSDSNINSDLVTFQRIDASVHNSLSGSRYIKGLDLVLKDKSGDAADKIVGLDVSMNVSANTFSVFTGDVLTMADKYSAVFNGGSVLIVSDNLVMPIQPSANLYIASQNNMSDLASMIVSNGSFFPFIVSGNKVGFGGDSSSSLGGLFELDVHNSDLDSEDSVFTIKDNGTVLVDFVITNNDSILLDLDRFENSSAANFKSLETDRLSIDSGDIFFFDYDKEFVGMKVATPLAHFHAHDILSAEAINKDRKIIKVDVASDSFQYDITGYDIDLSVADNNVLNGDVTGFVVDMTNFSVHDQSTIYGLWVDVTSNETETASSLVIVTGSVGIGFTEPRGVLDIDGVLFVKNDVKTPSSSIVIDAELATVNKLDVLGGVNINSDVHWSNVSINQELRFNNIFTPVGELVDFDYSAFLSADQILFRDTMDMRSGVSGTLFVSNNLLVGTETANFHSDQSIFIDTGSNKVAYFSDLIVTDDVFVIDEFIKPLDTSGVFYFDSDVTFNEGVINRLEVPYFSFGNNTNSRAYSLTVSSNSLWYQGIKLVVVTADNGLIPISAGVEGLITTDSFRIVTRDSVNMYSSQDHDVVEISGNVEINALIDDLNDFPSNGLQSFEGTLMYRSPSSIDGKLSMTGLKVNITSGNNNSGSFVYEGVSVDMTTLLADYYSDYDVVADIGKYAAVFEGGRVAIIASASDTVIPTPEMVDVYVSANFDHRTGHRDFFVEFDESSNEGYGFGVFATSNTLFVDIGASRNLNTILTSDYMVRVISDNNTNLMKIAESGQDLFLIKDDTVFIGNNFDDISNLSLYVKAYNPDDVLVSMEGLYIDNGVAIISNNIKTIADRVAVLDFMMDGSSQEYFKLYDASNTYASINTQFVIGAGSNLTNIPSNSFKLVLVSDNVTAPFFVGPSDDVVTHAVNDEIGYIVANKDDNNSFVSMFAMPSVNGKHVSHNRILFGSESLVIEAVDALKPALTIQEDSVGIFTDSSLLSEVSSSLVVDNLFSGQDYFLVVSSNSNYANLLVDEAGKVGVGVLVNENLGAELTVRGTVQVDTVENNDTGSGTYLSVNGPLEISAGELTGEAHNLNFAVTVNRSEEFSAYSVTTVLDMDAYNFNIADKRIIISTVNRAPSNFFDVWGVYVDVTSMDAKTVEGSYKYSGIFYGKTDGVLDSKFVIDNSTKDYDGWYTHHAKKNDDGTVACNKDQGALDMDRQTDCLKNINYFYPLTVIASSNIDVGVDLVSFSTLDSQGVSFNLITGGTVTINKQFSDGAGLADYKSMITGPSFINTVPFSPANVLVLQEHLNTIYEELTRADIIDPHGQVNVGNVDLESLLNLNLPMVDDNNTIEKNVLAVLENFVTQNVFFVKQTLAYDSNNNSIQTRDNICVVEGNIWGIDDPNLSNGDCAHTDFIAQGYEYENGEGIMYPLAFSTGFDPIYMQPYNVARVGINLVTTNNSFITGAIEFTETLVIGDGSVGTPGSNFDYREDIPIPLSTDPINSIGNKYCNGCPGNGPGTWTTDYGFHTDLADFAIQYGDSLITDNIHEYVETDQHSVTVRSLGNGNTKYRYMSYKTRYSDVRVGQYMPQSSFGDSNSFDAKVFFSGGTCISTALSDKDNCSDNDDIFTMGRENPLPLITSEPGEAFESTSYASYFRVDMTELDTSVKDIQFQIGFMDSSDIFTSPLVVGADLGTTFVGIGSLWNEQVRPKALLHVKDYSSFLVGTSSFDYLKTSGLSSERFVFGSNSLIETQFDSIQHSVDQFGIPTNIRSAAEEGAGCDGDHRIYNNHEVWANTFECTQSNGEYFCNDKTLVDYVGGTVGETFGRPITQNYVNNMMTSFGSYENPDESNDFNMDVYTAHPADNSDETVYSCHYYAWLVSDVLGLSFNDVPSTTGYLEAKDSLAVSSDCPSASGSSVSVVTNNWVQFVDDWNEGCFIEHLEARDVQNAAALKLSSSLTRFVPKAHSSVWSAASVVTTFDNGNYLNYSSMDDTNCRIIDWDGYIGSDERTVVGDRSIDPADTANLTAAQKANMLALMDATESKDDDYIATLDDVRVVNICATTMVNPVKIIRGSNTGYVFNDDDYLSRFEAVDIGQNLLALNYPQATLSEGTNFAAFFSGSGLVDQLALGEIEGLGDDLSGITGIQFSSPGRDYAEYMLKKDANQVMEPGDVVGVFGGELSFETEGADTVMVISSAPIIVGNFPGNDVKHLYELVAFLGQVPVKVSGKVTAGDILVVSGHGDGLAIAVAEDDLVASQLPFIIGRAWEGYKGEDVAYVNTLIGFSFNVEIINRYIEKAAKKLSHEKDATNQLETKLKSHLKQQQDFIKRLEKALTLNKE